MKNYDKEKYVASYLKWALKKEGVIDLPCYTSPIEQDEFERQIWQSCQFAQFADEDAEIVKILAPLTNDPNSPDQNGITTIHLAACGGHSEIVKILASLTDNPNAPDKD